MSQSSPNGEGSSTGDHGSMDEVSPAEPSGPQRPGRFYGPDRTWKNYTQPIRELAATLVQADCGDLGKHLYNAHMLKKRGQSLTHDTRYLAHVPKNLWVDTVEDEKMPFRPAPRWTAWPMRPDEVPRRREVWGAPTFWHEDQYEEEKSELAMWYHREPWLPSRHLLEELEAQILRQAQQNLQQRSTSSGNAKISIKTTQIRPAQLYRTGEHGEASAASDTVLWQDGSSSMSDDSSTDDDSDAEGDAVTKSGNSGHADGAEVFHLPASLPEPSILLDDSLAATIARPSLRECLKKVNSLLDALHRSRKGCRESFARCREEPLNPDSVVNDRKRRIGADQSNRSPRRTKTSSALSGARHSNLTRSHLKPRDLACRDWSEILALAATTGWDQSTIARTAQRCASLFRENMELRCMPEYGAPRANDNLFIFGPNQRKKATTQNATSGVPSLISSTMVKSTVLERNHRSISPGLAGGEPKQRLDRSGLLTPVTLRMPNSRF